MACSLLSLIIQIVIVGVAFLIVATFMIIAISLIQSFILILGAITDEIFEKDENDYL